MYGSFISSEFKKWLRDPLMSFMIFYPIVFGLLGRFVLPWIAETSGFTLAPFTDVILVVLTLITPLIYGALVGFSILDDRDDHILTSIKVTPLGIHQFLSFRFVLVFLLSFVASLFVMWFSHVGDIAFGHMVAISFLASFAAPISGLLINAMAKNKIEGFAMMKGSMTLLVFPVIALFFFDQKELFFSFAPGFWPAKAISSLVRGEGVLWLSYSQYYWIGLVYGIVVNVLSYRLFLAKTKV